VPWAKVLQLLVVNRLIRSGQRAGDSSPVVFCAAPWTSCWGWTLPSPARIGCIAAWTGSFEHKDSFCQFVADRWKTLFDTSFDVAACTSLFLQFRHGGDCAGRSPRAKHGYNRDGRRDCRQVVIALVVTPDGLPLAYEVLAGNSTDKTTLRQFLAKIEQMYGKAAAPGSWTGAFPPKRR